MNQATVLILSDDPDVAQAVVGRWQAERSVPGFVLLSSQLWTPDRAAVDLAVVGAVDAAQRDAALAGFDALQTPVIYVAADRSEMQACRSSRALTVAARDGWVESVVILGAEVLKR
ncbi:MAG TPA: hypothetical protein VFU76_10460, partial [Terriglobales bacterium]|nr:hypothetical protein [Terriglobales bacterium]